MCGIAGIYQARGQFPSHDERAAIVQRMISTLVHRGPDADGLWQDHDGRCVLGHRRLSIIDTSDAGRQPMALHDGRWWITFNGELYNYQELRKDLEAQGVQIRGRTDTEVLLSAVAKWGVDALQKMDGMFAFAAFDRATGELLIARDPFGEKPLYYMELPKGGLAFASELQALETVPGFDFDVGLDEMAELIMFQYIGAPRSIYRRVKKLPPGHWLKVSPGSAPVVQRYFQFLPGSGGFDDRPMADLADELEDILVRSLRRRMIADVPLGAFLSGGVDSSTVCALIRRKLNMPLMTFSTGFRDAPESEHLVAAAFARHLGTDHHEQVIAPNTNDFLGGIGSVLDEPNADSSCLPTYFLSQFARKHVTVAVSGDGGDEMFAGYGRYFTTLDEEQAALGGANGHWSAGASYYADRMLISTERYVEELFGQVPDNLAERLMRLRTEIDRPEPPLFCRIRQTDVENYLPGAVLTKVDRMSMRHSLEIRTPFLSIELARFAERLPLSRLYASGRGKLILKEIAYRYLPRELIDAPKKGFGIPINRWEQEELLGVASGLLETPDSRLQRSLGREAISRFMTRHRGGISVYQVWALTMFESWLRHHPARLPEFETVRGRAAAAKRRPAKLIAWPLGARRFAVWERAWKPGAPPTPSATRDLEARRMTLEALSMVYSVHGAEAPGGIPANVLENDPISLPAWEDLGATAYAGSKEFAGATFFFPRADVSKVMGARQLRAVARLGVSSLVFLHPHFEHDLVSLRLQPVSAWKRLWRALKLWPQRRGQCGRAKSLRPAKG